jgi:hypothetical protein
MRAVFAHYSSSKCGEQRDQGLPYSQQTLYSSTIDEDFNETDGSEYREGAGTAGGDAGEAGRIERGIAGRTT